MNKPNLHFGVQKAGKFFVDLAIFVAALFFAFFIRFEGLPDGAFLKQLLVLSPYIVVARISSFFLFSIYSIVWRYFTVIDVLAIFQASLPVSVLLLAARLWFPRSLPLLKLPLSVIVLEFLLVFIGSLGARLSVRYYLEQSERERLTLQKENARPRRSLLIGAGNAGNILLKELRQRPDLGYKIVGFIDDDPKKLNTLIQGVKVFGGTEGIGPIARRFKAEQAIIAIANAGSKDIKRIVGLCEDAKLHIKIVPALFEIMEEDARISKIRDVNIDDLLGRSVISLATHHPEVMGNFSQRKIMVTGAGGSIGSELCRQIAKYGPKELLLLDKDENSIYEVHQELSGGRHPFIITPLIADIRDQGRLENIMRRYRPEVLFHAAAHKHVPLMEFNPAEAVLNNVLGTQNAARLADRYELERFVTISTDKAVNPTSVMGATKKITEIIIQEIAARSRTHFSCVRFGNVLGSRGSVVPLFRKQIAAGGPITITHPEVRRYFMSISEAVQLIIQAGSIGQRGEIFVLDMGEPIKIKDMAKELIRLSGFKNEQIEIKYIGLRPGEKLYEELLFDAERTKATHFNKIFVAPPIEVDGEPFQAQLNALIEAARADDTDAILRSLKGLNIGYVKS